MKTFDFIIVGGGTSGTVTAEKLIKNGHTVLIIEEGKKNSNNYPDTNVSIDKLTNLVIQEIV